MSELPPIPPGFTLDQPVAGSLPPIPPGFALDPQSAASPHSGVMDQLKSIPGVGAIADWWHNQPSWADQMQAQTERDQQAFAQGGPKAMLALDPTSTMNLLGGFIGGSTPRAAGAVAKAETAIVPTSAELKASARAAYRSPEVSGVTLKPDVLANAADKIAAELSGAGFRPPNAPTTFGLLDDMRPPQGVTPSLPDVDAIRQAFGRTARQMGPDFKPTPDAAAASKVISGIDDFVRKLSPQDVLSGDMAKAAPILEGARGDYAASSRMARVEKALNDAEINAGAANSGANIGNATRQQLKPILKKAPPGGTVPGYDADETEALRQAVFGTPGGNLARTAGNLMGGGGGLGALHAMGAGAVAGGTVGGPVGALMGATAPAVGYGMKKLGDASVARNAANVQQMLGARSPLYASRVGQAAVANSLMPPPASAMAKLTPAARAALINALLAQRGQQP